MKSESKQISNRRLFTIIVCVVSIVIIAVAAVYYFNYVRPIRIKCKRKSPVQVRLEQAA